MIDHFLRDATGVSSCPFSSIVRQCGVRLPIHTLILDRAVSGERFLTGGVFECDIAHRRSVAVLCMLHNIRYNPMHPLYDALPGQYVPVRLHSVPWSHIGVLMRHLAAEPRSTAGLLFSSQCPSGTILLTPAVLDGARLAGFKSRANVFFIGLSRSIPTMVFYYFSLSLLPV